VVAATVTQPPGTVEFARMSSGEMEQNLRKAGMAMAIEILVHNQRNKALGMWQSAAQESAGLGKHLYVLFFDTAPEWQGRGCGAALLSFLGEVADADGVDSFLETAGGRNSGFYAKKGGYQETHRSPVASFGYDGGGVAMKRVPHATHTTRRDAKAAVIEARQEEKTSTTVRPPLPPPVVNTFACPPQVAQQTTTLGSPAVPEKENLPQHDTPPGVEKASDRMAHIPADQGIGMLRDAPPARSGRLEGGGSHVFASKRPRGPLASYCGHCGGHRAAHARC